MKPENPFQEKPFEGKIEPLQLHNPDHSGLVYDLLQHHHHWLTDDFTPDPIQMIGEMAENQQKQIATGWIAQRESQSKSEFLGIIWVEVDRFRIGRLFGAATPSVKNGISRDGIRFANQFIQYCFTTLKLRKLVAEVAITNRNAERFMQLLGFRKEGLLLNESLKNGQPVHWVRLQLLPTTQNNPRKIKRRRNK